MEWTYKRDETVAAAKTGIRRCVIVEAEEAVSKTSGNPMIVVTVRPSGSKAKVKSFIVKNANFDRNMTQFYESFTSIPEGSFDFVSWIGAEGIANFGINDRGYLEVKWWVSPEKCGELPPFEGEKPTQQTVEHFTPVADTDDMPF